MAFISASTFIRPEPEHKMLTRSQQALVAASAVSEHVFFSGKTVPPTFTVSVDLNQIPLKTYK